MSIILRIRPNAGLYEIAVRQQKAFQKLFDGEVCYRCYVLSIFSAIRKNGGR